VEERGALMNGGQRRGGERKDRSGSVLFRSVWGWTGFRAREADGVS
jgi:hypothetical protein